MTPLNPADWGPAREAYRALLKGYSYLPFSDTEDAYRNFMRRYGDGLMRAGALRRVGSGKGAFLANNQVFPTVAFGLMTRGIDDHTAAPNEAAA